MIVQLDKHRWFCYLKVMSDLKLILPKDWLPPQWEEISREGSEIQITIKLGHIDPENKTEPFTYQR